MSMCSGEVPDLASCVSNCSCWTSGENALTFGRNKMFDQREGRVIDASLQRRQTVAIPHSGAVHSDPKSSTCSKIRTRLSSGSRWIAGK